MVQISLAGQTCGKVEETSRSWWQCGTANQAVKHLVLFIATCIYLRVDTGQVHLQYTIQIIQMKPFKGLTKIQILHCFYFVAVLPFTKS